jgi:3-oxoacyl-[acyl-carrier protein] reductase
MTHAISLVELPKLYENMDEATIGPWLCAVGDKVSKDDVLVELITDKTVVEFESPAAGVVLAIYAQEKSTVPLGYVLCAIGPADAAAPDVSSVNEQKMTEHLSRNATLVDVSALMDAATPPPASKPSFKAAPAAKIFARQQGIDLADVATFCQREMIHRKDVENFIAQQAQPATDAAAPAAPATPATPAVPVATSTATPAAAAPSALTKPAAAFQLPPMDPAAPLRDKVALITGASGGIGSATARRLGAAGASVALHYHRGSAAAEQLQQELSAAGINCALFQADLALADSAKQLVDEVIAHFGHVDILVNNAGMLADAPLSFMSDELWQNCLDINLSAPFRLLRAVSMPMARQRWGRIINMCSDAGRMGSANRSNYAAAKEGLVGLTRSAARELAGLGIRVNAVSPGFIDSAMTANIKDKKRQELIKEIPVRRFGQDSEVAELVCFLSSPAVDYITGQVISIDGGLFMG